tara:strand:- start:249 stop:689 length:441 start_codon:yes stop_codon:yes gene_type:complete
MKKNIFKSGTRFECQGSANCCISRGSYGYVFLSKKDLSRLSKFFKITLQNFKLFFCQYTDNFIHLKEIRKNGECIFLKDKKCTVYKARPTQCRTWPFWPENMKSKVWNSEVINFCPGIGKGKFYSNKEIDKLIKKEMLNSSNIYKK